MHAGSFSGAARGGGGGAVKAKGVKKASCVEMSGKTPTLGVVVFYSQSFPLDLLNCSVL